VQVVIVPIYKGPDSKEKIDGRIGEIMRELRAAGIRVKFDNDDTARPGWKFAEHELKGVPIRMALGLRDIDNGVAEIARRDTREKSSVPLEGIVAHIEGLLKDIHQSMFDKALRFREENTRRVDSWEEFMRTLDETPGFIMAHWDGTPETEEKIKELSKATIRCIPLDNLQEAGACVLTGKPSQQRVLFARAY
jgi:prolyl-tRNA synthetase